MSMFPVLFSTLLLSQLCALGASFPPGLCYSVPRKLCPEMPRQQCTCLTHTSTQDTDCYHSQIILQHFYCPQTQECLQVVYKRGVPSATGNLLKCKTGKLYPDMTKQGLLVDLTTL